MRQREAQNCPPFNLVSVIQNTKGFHVWGQYLTKCRTFDPFWESHLKDDPREIKELRGHCEIARSKVLSTSFLFLPQDFLLENNYMRIGFWSKIGKLHALPTKVRIFQLFCTYWKNVDIILMAFFISCAKQTKMNEIGMQKVEHSSLCEWANLMIAKTYSVVREKGSNNSRKSSTNPPLTSIAEALKFCVHKCSIIIVSSMRWPQLLLTGGKMFLMTGTKSVFVH